jgi:hypothetical protein
MVAFTFLLISGSALAADGADKAAADSPQRTAPNSPQRTPPSSPQPIPPTSQQLHDSLLGIARSNGLSCDPWHDKHCLDLLSNLPKKSN